MAICKEEGCQVLSTGKCINNLELKSCPYFSEEDIDEEDELEDIDVIDEGGEILNESKKENPTNYEVVDVYSGKALELEEVNKISKSSLTRLIVLAGLPDAGKTTLVLSLMHMFQTNTSYQGYLFAGSETMLDYEEKSHPSKIESEKEKAQTTRTRLGQPTFFHLKVADERNISILTDLLFTDVSGEYFRSLRDSTTEAKKFELCKRADHFVLFFDTERITSFKERANSQASGLGILKSLNDAGTLLPHTRIQIIFSKWDLFSKFPDENTHNQYISALKEHINKQFGLIFEINFFEVSARPNNKDTEFGFGINKVFPLWVKLSILSLTRTSISFERKKSDRQYLNYNLKK